MRESAEKVFPRHRRERERESGQDMRRNCLFLYPCQHQYQQTADTDTYRRSYSNIRQYSRVARQRLGEGRFFQMLENCDFGRAMGAV